MTKKIVTTEAAKIARMIVKEAFPGVGFRIKSERATHIPVMRVTWEDGPTEHQVEQYLDRLCGSYYDCTGPDHRRKSREAVMMGETVDFEPWMISYTRSYSEQAVSRAVQAYVRCFPDVQGCVTVHRYQTGGLTLERRLGASHSIQSEIRMGLVRRTTVLGLPSTTAEHIRAIEAPQCQAQTRRTADDWDQLVNQVMEQVASKGADRIAAIIETVKPNDFGVIKTDELKRRVMRKLLQVIAPTTLTIIN